MTYDQSATSRYLEEAAALLRKAAETAHSTETRERIAMKFAQLAAIERGLIPAEMVGDLLPQQFRGR